MAYIQNKNPSWLANVGVIAIGEGYKNHSEVVDAMIKITEEDFDGYVPPGDYKSIKSGMSSFEQTFRAMDTSIGGSEVFNPYWQFGIDDDIIHPINDLSPEKNGRSGMGSIYNEMVYDNQKVLYLQMGVPRFSGLKNFFLDDNVGLAKLMKDGQPSLGMQIGALIGKTGKLMFNIAIWPITISNWLGDWFGSKDTGTKYYDFKPAMPLYFRLVNSVFSMMCVTLGIFSVGYDPAKSRAVRESALAQLEDVDLPEIMRNGPDIFAIMGKRNERANSPMPEGITSEYELLQSQQKADPESKEKSGIWAAFCQGFDDGLNGQNNWVGFKVEKTADASESINNETGEAEVASSLNSMVSQQRSLMFKIQGGNLDVMPDWAAGAFGFVKDIFAGAVQELGGNAALQMATGNGMFDIPHEWKDSKFNKNHSFTIKLRARYGDPASIAQCLYLPLALLMAASMPRAIGNNLYTSPFLVQAFCKGLFSVPLGMIESINIKRGGSEFGWSRQSLPLALDLDVTIKDLTPTMFLSMTDNEASIFSVSIRNTSLIDYIGTLGGLGSFDRYSYFRQLRDQKITACLNIKNTLFNPNFWGFWIGDHMGVFKTIYQMSPWAKGIDKYPAIGRSFNAKS